MASSPGNQHGSVALVRPVNLSALTGADLRLPPALVEVAYLPGGEAAGSANAETEIALGRPSRL